jgi:hypothetical protein
MIRNDQIFPTILIILDVCAAVIYLYDGDIRKTIYWIAAAVLTATVTY